MKNVETFIKALEENIRPGTKGAPARRELHRKVQEAQRSHSANMEGDAWRHRLERNGSYFDPQKGLNVPCDTRRHCPSDPKRRESAIKNRKRQVAASKIVEQVKDPATDNADALTLATKHGFHLGAGYEAVSLPRPIKHALSVEAGHYTMHDLLKLEKDETFSSIQVGAWTITTEQDIDEDRNYYSKAWHRQYGPKRTISNRRITFERPWGKGTRSVTHPLKSWSGNFVEAAIVAEGLAPKKAHTPLSVRLSKAYDAALIAEKRGYKIYRRTLLGKAFDWVIVSPLGMTYHDADRSKLVQGLHEKIRHQTRKLKGLIDWTACKKLGFCDSGIREFCSIFGLSPKESYTPQEVEAAVRQKPECAAPFVAELCTLSKSIGYNVAECN